jgi:hypothetical protein
MRPMNCRSCNKLDAAAPKVAFKHSLAVCPLLFSSPDISSCYSSCPHALSRGGPLSVLGITGYGNNKTSNTLLASTRARITGARGIESLLLTTDGDEFGSTFEGVLVGGWRDSSALFTPGPAPPGRTQNGRIPNG